MYTYGMKRLNLAGQLTVDELEQRYRHATDPVARSQWQILWLLVLGRPTIEVATVTGYSSTGMYAIVRRSNQAGAAAIGDRRHANPGKAPLLSPPQQAELEQVLDGPAPDGGLWPGPKVARWMSTKLGRTIHPV